MKTQGEDSGYGGLIQVRVRFHDKDRMLLVQMRDNGVGLQEDHLDKVFEPFFTTKGVGPGKGLGLAVVYGIVSEHGGKFDIDSREGEWTVVTFALPSGQARGRHAESV